MKTDVARLTISVLALVAFGTVNLAAQEESLTATLDLDEKLQPGTSMAWSPSGQAAWDALRQYHGITKVDLDPPSPSATAMDNFKWDPANVLPDGSVVWGGDDSEAVRARIRQELLRRAGPQAAAMIGPYEPPTLLPDGNVRVRSALFVSCISHAPKFPKSFVVETQKRPFALSGKPAMPAAGFGWKGTFDDNLLVLADDLAGSFILKLRFYANQGHPEFLLLASRPNMETLADGLKWMRETMKAPLPPDRTVEFEGKKWRYHHQLTALDSFWMPQLKMTLRCDYGDLIGGRYLKHNVGPANYWWQIGEAQQLLSFRLDAVGATTTAVFKVRPDFLSGGSAATEPSAQAQEEPLPLLPKHFTLNRPFLAALWRKDAEWPYLACWVDSEDLLMTK